MLRVSELESLQKSSRHLETFRKITLEEINESQQATFEEPVQTIEVMSLPQNRTLDVSGRFTKSVQ